MSVLFVTRSAKLGRWASDVGLGKHVYKVGVSENDPKAVIAAGWAGETDWKLVGRRLSDPQRDALKTLSRNAGEGRHLTPRSA